MREHPILFSSEMVKAILEGRKTKTRRVMNPQPCGYDPSLNADGKWEFCCDLHNEDELVKQHIYKPKYNIGDHLWVRETWKPCYDDGGGTSYRADWNEEEAKRTASPWKPSIFMPRKRSRLTLEVLNVRVERVQDISEEDAVAEGCKSTAVLTEDKSDYIGLYASEVFLNLWDLLNAKRGFGWGTQPWVWVITFKRI